MVRRFFSQRILVVWIQNFKRNIIERRSRFALLPYFNAWRASWAAFFLVFFGNTFNLSFKLNSFLLAPVYNDLLLVPRFTRLKTLLFFETDFLLNLDLKLWPHMDIRAVINGDGADVVIIICWLLNETFECWDFHLVVVHLEAEFFEIWSWLGALYSRGLWIGGLGDNCSNLDRRIGLWFPLGWRDGPWIV